jgi:hypothetical protein
MNRRKHLTLAMLGQALLTPDMGKRLATISKKLSQPVKGRAPMTLAFVDSDAIRTSAPNYDEPLEDMYGNTIHKRGHFGYTATIRRTLNIQNIMMPSGSYRMVLMFDDDTCISLPHLCNNARVILADDMDNQEMDCIELTGKQWATFQHRMIQCVQCAPGEKYIIQLLSPTT